MPDQPELNVPRGTARVFFALWPEEALSTRLDQAAARMHQSLGGRRTRRATIHMTLVFLGDMPRSRLAALVDAAGRIAGESFTLDLDRMDCWRHNRVAFLAPSEPPGALLALVNDLEAGLTSAGFSFDKRPYKPHVTLLRKADCGHEKPALEPISWAARAFVLVESVPGPAGVTYEVLARFPLA